MQRYHYSDLIDMSAMAYPIIGKVYVHANEKKYQHITVPLWATGDPRLLTKRKRCHVVTSSYHTFNNPTPIAASGHHAMFGVPPITHTIYEWRVCVGVLSREGPLNRSKWRMIVWHAIYLYSLPDWYSMFDV